VTLEQHNNKTKKKESKMDISTLINDLAGEVEKEGQELPDGNYSATVGKTVRTYVADGKPTSVILNFKATKEGFEGYNPVSAFLRISGGYEFENGSKIDNQAETIKTLLRTGLAASQVQYIMDQAAKATESGEIFEFEEAATVDIKVKKNEAGFTNVKVYKPKAK